MSAKGIVLFRWFGGYCPLREQWFYAEIAETYRVAEITEFFVSAARTVVLGRYNSVLSAT